MVKKGGPVSSELICHKPASVISTSLLRVALRMGWKGSGLPEIRDLPVIQDGISIPRKSSRVGAISRF